MSNVRLMYAYPFAPDSAIEAVEALGFDRIGYVPPRLYRKTRPHRFDLAKATRNLPQITAIVDGCDIIETDLEGPYRHAIRFPWNFSEEFVGEAQSNFIAMWVFFDRHFPTKRLSEWSLSTKGGDLVNDLVADHLDFISISLYVWRINQDWRTQNREVLARAVALSALYGLPIIASISERYRDRTNRDTKEYRPLPHGVMHDALDIAVSNELYGLYHWTYSYHVWANPHPSRQLTEQVQDIKNPLWSINAVNQGFASEMRLRAEARRNGR